MRKQKGTSLLEFPKDYVLLDIETTDFNPSFGDIIEIAIKRYRNNVEVDSYTSLINNNKSAPQHITELTGITNDMVATGKSLEQVLNESYDFIGDDTIIAHNAHFDINFIYDESVRVLGKPITNNFVDTLRLSRYLVKDIKNHKLKTLAEYFDIVNPDHRSVADVDSTHELYLKLLELYNNNPDLFKRKKQNRRYTKAFDLTTIVSDVDDIDDTNYFYDLNICFTGRMNQLTKKEAAQLVANLGARIQNNVTSTTNVLVHGDIKYQLEQFNDKSKKHKRAEELISKGQDLVIMTEGDFLELIE